MATQMRAATLVEFLPNIEIRDGLIHLSDDAGRAHYAIPEHLAERIMSAIRKAINIARNGQSNVIPLCELCVRHDLPKHSED